MSDDLRQAMGAEAGGGARPDVADLWRAGRRRRTIRRRTTLAASLAAAVVVAGIGVQVVRSEGSQTVRTAGSVGSCVPRAVVRSGLRTSTEAYVAEPAPQPPRSLAAMVHGGGTEELVEPDIVARVEVVSVDQRPPNPPEDEALLNDDGSGGSEPPAGERRARVVVTDPVFGAESGRRLTISDRGEEHRSLVLERATRTATAEVARYQARIDLVAQPLADLDARLLAMAADDPGYAALRAQRSSLERDVHGKLIPLQDKLGEAQQRLQLLQIDERLMGRPVAGTPCHRLAVGDDLIVALTSQHGTGRYELTGSSSFFLVDGDGFSDELDAARRSVPGWTDSELLQLARRSSPDQFLDRLRQAAAD